MILQSNRAGVGYSRIEISAYTRVANATLRQTTKHVEGKYYSYYYVELVYGHAPRTVG